jgi:hypothetical protein
LWKIDACVSLTHRKQNHFCNRFRNFIMDFKLVVAEIVD